MPDPGHSTKSARLFSKRRFLCWLFAGREHSHKGPHARPLHPEERHSWWQVMCLTGVDYFSTLGYQPGIAALAAGALSPIATLVLVLLTLFGALPIYSRVARESPNGQGSIAMLEKLLAWWTGKLFVLALLGFAATDFIITITLSAADATAHFIENPYAPAAFHGHPIAITLVLIGILGAIFLKGFKEAIGIAVALVAVYLVLNAVVVAVAIAHISCFRGLAKRLVRHARQPVGDARRLGAAVSEAGTRALGIRDRRRHDASRQRRAGR
jgi:hypothetical protein